MSRRRLFQRRRARIRAAGRWTNDEIVAAINAWAFMKGAPPTYQDWTSPDPQFGEHPSSRQVEGIFGSWSTAIEAAGYAPRPRHRPRSTFRPITS